MENNKPKIITYDGVRQSGCTTIAFNRAKELTLQGNTVLVVTDETRLTPSITNNMEWINKDMLKAILGRKFDYIIFDKSYNSGLITDTSIDERNYIGHADIILRFNGDKEKISEYIRNITRQEILKKLEMEFDKNENKINNLYLEDVIDFKEIEKLIYVQKYLEKISKNGD